MLKILVVDHVMPGLIAREMADFLPPCYTIESTDCPHDALTRIRENADTPYRAVLADERLPGLDALMLARILSADNFLRRTLFVWLAWRPSSEDLRLSWAAGAHTTLRKPRSYEETARMVPVLAREICRVIKGVEVRLIT